MLPTEPKCSPRTKWDLLEAWSLPAPRALVPMSADLQLQEEEKESLLCLRGGAGGQGEDLPRRLDRHWLGKVEPHWEEGG